MNQTKQLNGMHCQLAYCIFAFVVSLGVSLPPIGWAGVDKVFTEKTAKAYCQKSKTRKGVKANTQNQCCAAVTKQCHQSCSKQKSGRIACSGGCNAAFESCWDTKEKPTTFRVKWMYNYCKKRHRRVKSHNACCRTMDLTCGEACDHKYPPSRRGSCMDRCETAKDTCLRVAKKVKKKPFNPNWMNEYCASARKRKKIKAKDHIDCCLTMHDRCWNACDGYKPSERGACKDRCSTAIDRCRKN